MMLENEVVLLHRFAKTGDAEAFSEVVQRHAGLEDRKMAGGQKDV
ncbi:MAG: hypothetical protein ACYSWZ_09285 [Planctomycetota bacterium]|jgi:hypothetical protein